IGAGPYHGSPRLSGPAGTDIIASMHRHRAVGFLLVLALGQSLAISASPDSLAPALNDKLVKDLTYLASDDLEGRGLGPPGLEQAGNYIAARFKSLGLRALPNCPEYFEPFTVAAASSVKARSSLGTSDKKFELNKQFIPQGFSPSGEFTGPVAFV